MAEAFKFLDSEHAHCLTEHGEIRFGDLRRYRLMEVAFEDMWIGDKLDGAAETDLGAIHISDDPKDRAHKEMAKKWGIADVSGGGVLQVGQLTTRSEINGFAFSCSIGELDHLTETMCRSPKRPNYDACVRITDLEELNRRVLAIMQAHGLSPEHVPAKEVSYAKGNVGAATEPAFGDPFIKRDAYSGQSEFRIFIKCKSPGNDFLTLEVGADLFERLPVEALPNAKPTEMSKDEARDLLRAFIDGKRPGSEKSIAAKAYYTVRPLGGVEWLDMLFTDPRYDPDRLGYMLDSARLELSL